jgi:predicted ArsR family transcriptional regulator
MIIELPEAAPADVIMMTAGEIAQRDGVTPQAVTKKFRELAERGLEVERDARGRISKANVVQYDLLRDRVGDPSKDQRPQREEEPTLAADPQSYDEALRKKTWYEAERKRLELEEQVGALIKVAEIEQAIDACAEAIAAVVRRLQSETDALATAVTRDGVHGLRVALKALETRMLADIATALDGIAEGRANPE